MRKALVVLAVVFTTAIFTSGGVDAAQTTTKHKASPQVTQKHKTMVVKCAKPMTTHKYHKRTSKRATYGRGPIVRCPAPVVNVPKQPAPVVNIPPEQPSVGVATDATNIYVVRGNTLTTINKCSKQVISTVTLP